MACGQMCHYADRLNVTFSSALLPADMNGFYDEATGTILSQQVAHPLAGH